MNGSDVRILPGECRQAMRNPLTFKLNVDKALKDVTGHFGLKLSHLIFFLMVKSNMEITATITGGFSPSRHQATCLVNSISFAAMKIFHVILTTMEASRV